MSEKMLQATLVNLKPELMNDDDLDGFEVSLNAIIDNDTFSVTTQEEALCKLLKIQEIKALKIAHQEATQQRINKEATEKATKKKKDTESTVFFFDKIIPISFSDEVEEFDDDDGMSDSDQIARHMVRSNLDGTYSFTFKGTDWQWDDANHMWKAIPK
jgi:hypothetical protein